MWTTEGGVCKLQLISYLCICWRKRSERRKYTIRRKGQGRKQENRERWGLIWENLKKMETLQSFVLFPCCSLPQTSPFKSVLAVYALSLFFHFSPPPPLFPCSALHQLPFSKPFLWLICVEFTLGPPQWDQFWVKVSVQHWRVWHEITSATLNICL